MKKTLVIVSAGVSLAVAVIVVMVVMANRVGDSVQRDFFAVVATNDPALFLKAADPRMHDEIDAPLLQQWMQALNERLGPYRGLDASDFHSSTRFENGNRIVETKGTVEFEKGAAYSELTYVNEKLAHFHVTSKQMEDNWFREPDDTTIYRAQAETFYAELATENADAAFEIMSEELQRNVPIERFRELVAKIKEGLGTLDTIHFVDDEFLESEKDGQRLIVRFKLVGTGATYLADVVFVFGGLKAQFIEFNASPEVVVPVSDAE